MKKRCVSAHRHTHTIHIGGFWKVAFLLELPYKFKFMPTFAFWRILKQAKHLLEKSLEWREFLHSMSLRALIYPKRLLPCPFLQAQVLHFLQDLIQKPHCPSTQASSGSTGQRQFPVLLLPWRLSYHRLLFALSGLQSYFTWCWCHLWACHLPRSKQVPIGQGLCLTHL